MKGWGTHSEGPTSLGCSAHWVGLSPARMAVRVPKDPAALAPRAAPETSSGPSFLLVFSDKGDSSEQLI